MLELHGRTGVTIRVHNKIRERVKDALGRLSSLSGVYGRRFNSQATMVAFHRVNDTIDADGLTCGSAKFEAFCRFFRQHFRVISLSEFLVSRRAGKDVRGTLVITFDDGYQDNFRVAAPILHRLHLPATFFVTTGFIGTEVVAPWDAALPPQPWMSWDEVRKLKAMGFEIGSHTDSHIDLGSADPAAIRADLKISMDRLAQELGSPVSQFAYPFGGPEHISSISRELVREAGFTCCLSCHGGINSGVLDPFELKRIPIGKWFSSPHQFGFELLQAAARYQPVTATAQPI
jgi:peptidoglycan/xylan/chitin deacetylase (PgdA/CDA1 family)